MTDKRSQSEIIIKYLEEQDDFMPWVPSFELKQKETRYGYIGSAGDVRARELAREGLIERAWGKQIGLDRRYMFFRCRPVQQGALEI